MSRFKSSSASISDNSAGCLFDWFKGRPLACSYKGSLVHDEISAKKLSNSIPFGLFVSKTPRERCNIFTLISSAISTWMLKGMPRIRSSSVIISSATLWLTFAGGFS